MMTLLIGYGLGILTALLIAVIVSGDDSNGDYF